VHYTVVLHVSVVVLAVVSELWHPSVLNQQQYLSHTNCLSRSIVKLLLAALNLAATIMTILSAMFDSGTSCLGPFSSASAMDTNNVDSNIITMSVGN